MPSCSDLGAHMTSNSEPRLSKQRKEKLSEVKKGFKSKKEGGGWKGWSCYEAAGGVRGDQDHPKTAPRPPKIAPRSPKTTPRPPQDRPVGKLPPSFRKRSERKEERREEKRSEAKRREEKRKEEKRREERERREATEEKRKEESREERRR